MTVSTSYAPLSFSGNGATTAFAVTWPFFDSSLVVTLVDSTGVETVKTITTHYTVSGGTDSDGLPATGTVTMLTAPASGETLRITRNTSKVQSSSWTNGGAYQAKTLEATLDKIILIAQETQAGINDDITGDVMMLNTSGATDYWDAEDQIIQNVGTSTTPDAAVNYQQLADAVLAAGNWLGTTGNTDNAVLRANGTGGATLQSSSVTISDEGDIAGANSIDIPLVSPVADRTALKALSTSLYTTAYLREDGREGIFEWDPAVLIATHTADANEATYVAPDSGSNGAWVRRIGVLPVLLLSQQAGASASARWTAAMSALSGGGTLIVDEDISAAAQLTTISADRVRVIGKTGAETITFTASTTYGIRVTGDFCEISSLIVRGSTYVTYLVSVDGNDFVSRDMDIEADSSATVAYGYNLVGSRQRIERAKIDAVYGAIRCINATGDAREDYTINSPIIGPDIGAGRGISFGFAGGTAGGSFKKIRILFPEFPDSTNNYQPIRVDAQRSTTIETVQDVLILGARIIHPSATVASGKKADSIAIRGVERSQVIGCTIDRYTDVGITNDGGVKWSVVANNVISRAKTPLLVGVVYDRSTLSVRNEHVIIANNVVEINRDGDSDASFCWCKVSDNVTFTGNRGKFIGTTNDAYWLIHEDVTGVVFDRSNYVDGATGYFNDTNAATYDSLFVQKEAIIGEIEIFKRADETTSSDTTLNNDGELLTDVVANAVYEYELVFLYETNTTANIKRVWSVPSGTTIRYFSDNTATTGADTGNGVSTLALTGHATSTLRAYVERGIITVSSTAGTVALRWAQNVSDASNTTVKAGSKMILRRVL